MPRAAFITLGCKVNQYDTQLMRESLQRQGFEIIPENDEADLYVINTCTVTNVSDRKARQLIRKVVRQHPEARIVVTGCYADSGREELIDLDGVSLVLGNAEKPQLASNLLQLEWASQQGAIQPLDDLAEHRRFAGGIHSFGGQTRAIVKVQDGCSAGCTYCIIPTVRGPISSRPIPDIVHEVERLAQNGYREIVITGVHLGAYGKDIRRVANLADVLESIHPIEGIERIRLSSIEPMDVPPAFIERVSRLPKCVPHFHLPIQSGSDTVLRRMRRRYTASKLRRIVGLLRDAYPDLGLTTDVMVGFPGESNDEFQQTYDLIAELRFSQLHVFRYSPRKGTPAAAYDEQVPPTVAAERSERVRTLGAQLMRRFEEAHLGQTMSVLIEDKREGRNKQLAGFTGNYLRVLTDAGEESVNQVVAVTLKAICDDTLEGSLQTELSIAN